MKRILIVDDEEMIVRTVKAYLDREGFKTYTAFDGEAALQAFTEKGPDLIILDLMLPKMSGIEVTRAIRAKSSVPIIMLTAKAAEADRVVGLELGADDYVVKPFSPRELVARVRAVLRRYEGEGMEVERIIRVPRPASGAGVHAPPAPPRGPGVHVRFLRPDDRYPRQEPEAEDRSRSEVATLHPDGARGRVSIRPPDVICSAGSRSP